MEEQARARQTGGTRSELARATLFIGGMYCTKCTDTIRDSLSRVRGVIEVLVTNYVESPYGIVHVFYDSRQVTTDEFLAHLRTPYWATLIRQGPETGKDASEIHGNLRLLRTEPARRTEKDS